MEAEHGPTMIWVWGHRGRDQAAGEDSGSFPNLGIWRGALCLVPQELLTSWGSRQHKPALVPSKGKDGVREEACSQGTRPRERSAFNRGDWQQGHARSPSPSWPTRLAAPLLVCQVPARGRDPEAQERCLALLPRHFLQQALARVQKDEH